MPTQKFQETPDSKNDPEYVPPSESETSLPKKDTKRKRKKGADADRDVGTSGIDDREVKRAVMAFLQDFDEEEPEKKRRYRNYEKNPRVDAYTETEWTYYSSIKMKERKRIAAVEKEFEDLQTTPLRFQVLALEGMDRDSKVTLLQNVELLTQQEEAQSEEYHKYLQWVRTVLRVPFGKYHEPMAPEHLRDPVAIGGLLREAESRMDTKIYGHQAAKQQILKTLGQWFANPGSRASCLAVSGPPGVGKTSLLHHGIAEALQMPFHTISLGGMSGNELLTGHDFTYIGSKPGRIVEALIAAHSMSVCFFFEELDKVSENASGQEIIHLLMNLIDPMYAKQFQDRYLGGIKLDLSRCMFCFAYNDEAKIDPILRDRLITIQVTPYSLADKVQIAQRHLLPQLNAQFGFDASDIWIDDSVLALLIHKTRKEEGVRELKRTLEFLYGTWNLARFMKDPPLTFPMKVNAEEIEKRMRQRLSTTEINPSLVHLYT